MLEDQAFRGDLRALYQALDTLGAARLVEDRAWRARLPLAFETSGPEPLPSALQPIADEVARFRQRWPLPTTRQLCDVYWSWRLWHAAGAVVLVPGSLLVSVPEYPATVQLPELEWSPAEHSRAELAQELERLYDEVRCQVRAHEDKVLAAFEQRGWTRPPANWNPELAAERLYQRLVLKRSWREIARHELGTRDPQAVESRRKTIEAQTRRAAVLIHLTI
jgi:hypothetical protein